MMFSDVQSWLPFENALAVFRPDLILMGGDLTIDRFSLAHKEAALLLPKFWKNLAELLVSQDIWDHLPTWLKERINERTEREGTLDEGGHVRAILRYTKKAIWEEYENRAERIDIEIRRIIADIRTPDEEVISRHMQKTLELLPYSVVLDRYGNEFHRALKLASRESINVFTVKGNHDTAFFRYNTEIIESIPLCKPIDGQVVAFRGLKILGLGASETLNKERLAHFVGEIREQVDVVVCHASKDYYRPTLSLRPKLIYGHIVRGPQRMAIRKQEDMFLVYASFPHFVLAKFEENGSIRSVTLMRYREPEYIAGEHDLIKEGEDKWVEVSQYLTYSQNTCVTKFQAKEYSPKLWNSERKA